MKAIEVPSGDDRCESRPRDDWFAFDVPRCGARVCPLPQPGESFSSSLSLVKNLPDDDLGVPVRVKVTVLRHERPLVILAVKYLGHVYPDQRMYAVAFAGELAVRVTPDDEARIDPTSWR